MARGKKVSPEIRKLVLEKKRDGLSIGNIQSQLSLPRRTVYQIIIDDGKKAKTGRPPKKGRPRHLSVTEVERVVRHVKGNRRRKLNDLTNFANQHRAEPVCSKTVKRSIERRGYKSRLAVHTPFISEVNRQKRLDFARKYVNKPLSFWRAWFWSDECSMQLFGKRRMRVWRRPEEAHSRAATVATVKSKSKTAMFWVMICRKKAYTPYWVKGNMNGAQYRDVLKTRVVRNLKDNPEAIFQDDNAPCHRSGLVKNYLATTTLKTVTWPPQSPDMSPVENVFSIVKKNLQESRHPPRNIQQLKEFVDKELQFFPKKTLEHLVDSMPRRCEMVIANNGFAIPY